MKRGPFANLQSSFCWSGTEYSLDTHGAWVFIFSNGGQYVDDKETFLSALAVHDGNVGAPVPIPAAAGLLGSGLIGLVAIRRRFKK